MNQQNEMKHTPGFKAAGALIAYFGKKGNVTGHFDIAEIAEVINEQTAAPQLLEALQQAMRLIAIGAKLKDPQDYCFRYVVEPLEPCDCEYCQLRAALTLATTK